MYSDLLQLHRLLSIKLLSQEFWKNRVILYFKMLWRYQHLFLCVLCIKFKRRTLVCFICESRYLLPTLTWPHHPTSAPVHVQKASSTLSHCIEVSVRSQKIVNYHVYTCCAYRFCLHFYLFLVEFWNCPDGVALISFSQFWGTFRLELYFIIIRKLVLYYN